MKMSNLQHSISLLLGIEIYPLNSDEYAYLHECGADFVSVYQETYNIEKYEQVHLSGSKEFFPTDYILRNEHC